MSARFTETEVEALLALPRPDTAAMKDLSPEERKEIDNRVSALVKLINGAPVKEVARRHGIHRKTCSRMLDLVAQPGLDGNLHGFAVCIPGVRLVDPQPRTTGVPLLGRSHAMTQLVKAIPDLQKQIAKFKGNLPTRTQSSPAFDRIYKEMKRILKAGDQEDGYPLNTRDKGRRALATFIARERERLAERAMLHATPTALTRLADLSPIDPFDEVQFDAHWIDLKGLMVAVPLVDGTYTLAPITGLWLLVQFDVGSRSCPAWSIVVGPSYNQLEMLRTVARSLVPWQPRDLTGRRIMYLPNAWMPSSTDSSPPRALQTSMDNFSGHIAKHARRAMLTHHLGVLHFGVAGIPETRGSIEAFFKKIEAEILRYLAGGFEPETKDRKEQTVSNRNASDYPIFLDLLEDFVDVAITSYHVAPHAQMSNRSPREVVERFLDAGGMPLRSSRSALDARNLTRLRIEVTIRGNKSKGVLPHVNYGYGIYRSEKLNVRWDLIGKRFHAYIEEDARDLQLLDEAGLPYVTLRTLPPYSRTPHSLEQRRRAEQWRRSRPGGIEGIDDLIEAYHADVRERARSIKWAADAVASGTVPPVAPQGKPRASFSANTLAGLPPRGGPVRLR